MARRKKIRPSDTKVSWDEEMDAERAQEFLDTMRTNRRIRSDRVKTYLRAMLLGEWQPTHQGLGFNKKGQLFDGQHRCLALITAEKRQPGITIPVQVTLGLSEEARAVTDTGAQRLTSDELTMQGIPQAKMRMAWVRRLCTILFTSTVKVGSAQDYHRWARALKSDLSWALDNMSSEKKLKPAAVAAAMIVARMAHPDAAEQIVAVVKGEVPSMKGEPGWALDQFLAKHTDQPRGQRSNMSYANYDLMSKYVAQCVEAQALGKRSPKPNVDSVALDSCRDAALKLRRVKKLSRDILEDNED